MDQVIGAGGIDANLAPDAFHRWAADYYKCKQDFQPPHTFSPVPYFLLCRAIELEIKSTHLRHMTQPQVKAKFGHKLLKAYDALDSAERTLTPSEESILRSANNIYSDKGFEYFDPGDALTAYSRYPDLTLLDAIARKLIGI